MAGMGMEFKEGMEPDESTMPHSAWMFDDVLPVRARAAHSPVCSHTRAVGRGPASHLPPARVRNVQNTIVMALGLARARRRSRSALKSGGGSLK